MRTVFDDRRPRPLLEIGARVTFTRLEGDVAHGKTLRVYYDPWIDAVRVCIQADGFDSPQWCLAQNIIERELDDGMLF